MSKFMRISADADPDADPDAELRYTSTAHKKFRVLFENRPALYFCKYKGKKKIHVYWIPTLFIDDFSDIMVIISIIRIIIK